MIQTTVEIFLYFVLTTEAFDGKYWAIFMFDPLEKKITLKQVHPVHVSPTEIIEVSGFFLRFL